MFNFNFGNKKPNIKQYAIIGLILTTIITSVSRCTQIDEKLIWDLFDEVQRKHNPQSPVNDFIIKDPEKLQRRITRDVDSAIDKATPEYYSIIREADKKFQPIIMDLEPNPEECYTDACKALGPPMRICAPWAENCLNTHGLQ